MSIENQEHGQEQEAPKAQSVAASAGSALSRLFGRILGAAKSHDYAESRDKLYMATESARHLLARLVRAAGRATVVTSVQMRRLSQGFMDKNPAIGKYADVLFFFSVYTVVFEFVNLIEFQYYLGTFLIRTAPLLVVAVAARLSRGNSEQ